MLFVFVRLCYLYLYLCSPLRPPADFLFAHVLYLQKRDQHALIGPSSDTVVRKLHTTVGQLFFVKAVGIDPWDLNKCFSNKLQTSKFWRAKQMLLLVIVSHKQSEESIGPI